MKSKILKKPNLILENERSVDLFGWERQSFRILERINTLENNSMIGLIAPFGTGKTNLLNKVQSKDEQNVWFTFDAWKYPNKSDLWEGFLIDLAYFFDRRDEIVNTLDGKKLDSITELPTLVGIPKLEKIFKYFVNSSPATRVFQQQELLITVFNLLDSDIVVIIEDLDRSGDGGSYFLETLKLFLVNNKFNHKIKVVVPISNKSFLDNLNHYNKCFDYAEIIELKADEYEEFTNSIFNFEKMESDMSNKDGDSHTPAQFLQSQISSFIKALAEEHNISIRMIKLILRESISKYEMLKQPDQKPDFRVCLGVEASKYIYTNKKKEQILFDYIKLNNKPPRDSIFASLIGMIIMGKATIYTPDNKRLKSNLEVSFFEPASSVYLHVPFNNKDHIEQVKYLVSNIYL